jgi:hypothetical protein
MACISSKIIKVSFGSISTPVSADKKGKISLG